ncbi:hypothetical protein OL239_07760 [Arthrobacter sp. ATA002]|uniref:DUF6993 domain-containing protein n=1 Tax=Arthrobacter sp. ATA002 TaxID=2991715 RepID=UPI0022A71D63|nr:hypothetical protein [Arthrobacter sp. ATA002]WAP52996.1 hypothetical protein OL239_07760 [Arthrobacter sp. ATA002]
MIRAPRNRRLSLLTLTVLLAGSAALLAPAAVPAAPGAAGPVEVAGVAAPALPVASQPTADTLTASLTALAAATPTPSRDEVRRAFTEAGFTAGSVEVSLDRTPTGLAVDSIRGAAPHGGDCLFGEVREGQVAVTALPLLDSGFCFVGDQR